MQTILETINGGIRHAETNISAEEWRQMIADGIVLPKQLEAMLAFYREPNHEGVCNVLAKKLGGTTNYYNNAVWQLGKRVKEHLGRFEVVGVDDQGNTLRENVYWCVPMDGRNSKQGFVYTVKPELCEALADYLYQYLLDTYKEHRKAHTLSEDDELYKWQLIDEAQGKDNIEQALYLLNHPHNNLMSWRLIDFFKKYIANQPAKAEQMFADLYDENKDIKERVENFLAITENGFTTDERSVSVFLACHAPEKHLIYKDSYYQTLCKYLGVKAQPAGHKYEHYLSLMAPLVKLIEEDDEVAQLLAEDIGSLTNSPLLIAQDIVYILFDHNIITTGRKNMFDWIPFYEELAKKLLAFKDKREELAQLIYGKFDREKDIKFLHDGDGSDFTELDPFTVYSIITRNMKGRTALAQKLKDLFDMDAPAPQSFDGLPVQNPLNAAFITFSKDRSTDGKDVERFWTLFELALQNDTDFEDAFDSVLKQKGVAIPKLTMGLYYICPNRYLALDGNNRKYLEQYGIDTTDFRNWKYADYQRLLQTVKDKMNDKSIKEQTFPEFSANAYGHEEDEEEEYTYYDEWADLLRYKKNMIIKGAPGVGKTFELYRIITRLCHPELRGASDDVLHQAFNKLKSEHRVEFVTFHQSMDYEEFVEGIRPKTENGNVVYETEDGIFKQLCEEARRPIVEANPLQIKGDAVVWKVSLAGTGDNPVRTECLKNGHIRIGWDEWGADLSNAPEGKYDGRVILNAFYDKMKVGDIVFSCYSSRTIDAIGVVTGDAEWDNSYNEYKRVRPVKWLIKGINEDIVSLNGDTVMTLGTVYRLNNITLEKVFSLLNKHNVRSTAVARKNTNPYVLVIDEINRGNVSKIFGELITLLEADKREGQPSETSVRLPYSKKPFSIPDNLYIIGTMNTADRSLDALDYAMRRRFATVTFKPVSLVDDVEGFNEDLFKLVSALFVKNYEEYAGDNDVKLVPADCLSDDILPEDVWVGHSYFIMQDEQGRDVTNLRITYEIIPILEEYLKDGVFKNQEAVQDVIQRLKEYDSDDTDN